MGMLDKCVHGNLLDDDCPKCEQEHVEYLKERAALGLPRKPDVESDHQEFLRESDTFDTYDPYDAIPFGDAQRWEDEQVFADRDFADEPSDDDPTDYPDDAESPSFDGGDTE